MNLPQIARVGLNALAQKGRIGIYMTYHRTREINFFADQADAEWMRRNFGGNLVQVGNGWTLTVAPDLSWDRVLQTIREVNEDYS